MARWHLSEFLSEKGKNLKGGESVDQKEQDTFLECERHRVFLLLMMVGGFYGAYTYTVRGGVFCNAQTANFVLLAMALGNLHWGKALYYLIPMTAYLLGTVVSEAIAKPVRRYGIIRWDTMLIIIEIVLVIILGFVPDDAPYQITQVAINFIASMQYNTFRQAEKVPMATTFCTNHLRQIGIALVKVGEGKEESKFLKRISIHGRMLLFFVLGGTASAALCRFFGGKALFFALIPLGILLFDLLYADIKLEKGDFFRKPAGH